MSKFCQSSRPRRSPIPLKRCITRRFRLRPPPNGCGKPKLRSDRTAIAVMLLLAVCASQANAAAEPPTFYRDVLPILEQRCQSCHRPGEIAPFSLVTFKETKPWALPILDSIKNGKMPPWFADPCCGHFANNPLLSRDQIATMANWVAAGAPSGDPKSAPPPPHWTTGWNIAPPDLVLKMPAPVRLPAQGDVEYTYEIVPTNFTEGKWVEMSELRPSARNHVHHAVVYIRPPGSNWLRGAPVGVPFTASSLHDPHLMHEAHSTTSDLLLVYAPGSSSGRWPRGRWSCNGFEKSGQSARESILPYLEESFQASCRAHKPATGHW